MAFLSEERFTFTSQGLPPDTFGVIRFEGHEGLSLCYRFVVELVSSNMEMDLDLVLSSPATFTIKRPGGDLPFHGILSEFEQLQAFGDYGFYRAELVPKLWWLRLTFHNQVFLDKSVPEIMTEVLKDGGLTAGRDFELRLQGDYPSREYVCQYNESHFAFVNRWMEREGMYYFFEQNDDGEKMVVTDTMISHSIMPQGSSLRYSPPSGLEAAHRDEIVHSFVCRQMPLPAGVELKDYNYRTPNQALTAKAEVSPTGRGEVYIYGLHFKTEEEGQALAAIRSQALLSRERIFMGESSAGWLRPGYVFSLTDHYRAEFNQEYLTVEVTHRGNQAGYLISGLRDALAGAEEKLHYSNEFTLIPSSVQFRPDLETQPSKINGTMNARIDAAGSGKYAELDHQGRYKVILPFDLSGRSRGKASAFLRMAQPYAGSDHGMHFPLHKGTEVLLTFIDGNPDRPIIAGAVPNPETSSPVNDANQTRNVIQTAGGNQIYMEDQENNQRVLFSSPSENSWLRMGSPNDPPPKRPKAWPGGRFTPRSGSGSIWASRIPYSSSNPHPRKSAESP